MSAKALSFALTGLCLSAGCLEPLGDSPSERSTAVAAAAFTAVAVSSTEISVSWPMSTETDTAGYHLFRDGTAIATLAATTFLDRNLMAATTYSYTYLSFDSAGNRSPISQPVTATTLADNSPKSFANDVFPILQACAGCHSDYAAARTAYLSVMGRGIGVCGGRVTIVPGSAVRSLLYQKITGSHDCGVVMPPSGRLSSQQASIVGSWINQGAADN